MYNHGKQAYRFKNLGNRKYCSNRFIRADIVFECVVVDVKNCFNCLSFRTMDEEKSYASDFSIVKDFSLRFEMTCGELSLNKKDPNSKLPGSKKKIKKIISG